jgi:hypothetical protein
LFTASKQQVRKKNAEHIPCWCAQVVNALDVVISDLQSTQRLVTSTSNLTSSLPAVVNSQQIKSEIEGIQGSLSQILNSMPPQVFRCMYDSHILVHVWLPYPGTYMAPISWYMHGSHILAVLLPCSNSDNKSLGQG